MTWIAIAWSGFVATILSAALFWALRALGWTPFSPSIQLGTLFLRDPRSPVTETLGFVLLLLLGSTLVPAVYAFLLDRLGEPSATLGAALGAAHGLLTAALLPAWGAVSAGVRSGLVPPPGRLGLGWGRPTPVGIVVGHVVFGGVLGAILAGFASV
jgi:hypothetical protein